MRTGLEDQPTDRSGSSATGVLGLFSLLSGLVRRRVVFGVMQEPGALGSITTWSRNVPHGQGKTPIWCLVWSSTAISTGDTVDPVCVSRTGVSATDITVRCRVISGGTVNSPANNYYWIGIF